MGKKTFFTGLIILSLIAIASAQVPQLINYQGVLTDASDNPITGSRSITFAIYAGPSGGSALWSETRAVTIDNGLFNILLGESSPIPFSVFSGGDRYLELKVGSDSPMTPRKRLVSVGYSFRSYDADKVDGKDAADFVQSGQTNSISSGMIQGNAVTADKISPNIVSSIDGVTNDGGNIDLVAGANVTITPDDGNNRITIAASPGGAGDNLGNHIATQNVRLNNYYLSNDGGSEGLRVDNSGNVTASGNLLADKLQGGGATSANVGVYGTSSTYNAAWFSIPSSSNVYNCLRATTSSTHVNSDALEVSASTGNALDASASGNEPTIIARNNSTGRTAYFYTSASGNSSPVLEAYTGGTGSAAYLRATNTNNLSPTLEVLTNGRGNAAYFHIDNTSSSYNCLRATTSSTSSASDALEVSAQSGNALDALAKGSQPTVTASNTGTGHAGYFSVSNSSSSGYGIYARTSGSGYAGYFYGNARVTGTLSKGGGSFMIDHPLEPTTKYLSHSFVESPDMMNIYNGNIILDANGEAWVTLPDWFDALNKDFRYQLTCIGGFAPLYVDQEISNNQFKIAGGKAAMKVSWQVTGIRHDPFAEANRIQVESAKRGDERGKYLHPKAYGVSETMGIDYEKNTNIEEVQTIEQAQELTPPVIEENQHSEEKNL